MSTRDLDTRAKGAILIGLLAALFLLGPYFGIRLIAGNPEPLPPLPKTPLRVESIAPEQPDKNEVIVDDDDPGKGLKGIEDLLQ